MVKANFFMNFFIDESWQINNVISGILERVNLCPNGACLEVESSVCHQLLGTKRYLKIQF